MRLAVTPDEPVLGMAMRKLIASFSRLRRF